MARLGQLQVELGLLDADGGYGGYDDQYFARVTDYVLSATYQWGRDRFIHGDFETGIATVVLNNDSGEWSPYSGVNEVGDNKLRPGMLVRLLYSVPDPELEDWLEDETGANWIYTIGGGGLPFMRRDVANAETFTGYVDGATWTTHGTALDVMVQAGFNSPPAASAGSADMVRFLGRVYSVEDQYDEGGQGSITVVTVVDLLADLAQYNPGELGVAEPIEATGGLGRWQYIYLAALNDANLVGTNDLGIYDVEASTLPSNYLEEARVAARAEGGAVFADHGQQMGRTSFKDANWLISDRRSATTQAHIGDTRIGITAATTSYSLARVFNTLNYSNSATTVTVTNAASIATYSARTLARTLLNSDNTDLASIAARDLALLKDAKLVISQIVVHPQTLFEVMWAKQVTVGDLLEVTIENRDWSYTQPLHVSGVSESWTAASDDWTLTLRLDSREGDTVLT